MMIRNLVTGAALLAAVPAMAQTAPQPLDPRTSTQTVDALQAIITLREAQLKALQEDARKRESDWAAYSAPLWQEPKD